MRTCPRRQDVCLTSSDSHCRVTHHPDASFLLFFHCRARFLISLGAGVLSGHLAGAKSSLLCFSWPWGFGVDETSKPRPGDQQETGIRHREVGPLCVVREAGKESHSAAEWATGLLPTCCVAVSWCCFCHELKSPGDDLRGGHTPAHMPAWARISRV